MVACLRLRSVRRGVSGNRIARGIATYVFPRMFKTFLRVLCGFLLRVSTVDGFKKDFLSESTRQRERRQLLLTWAVFPCCCGQDSLQLAKFSALSKWRWQWLNSLSWRDGVYPRVSPLRFRLERPVTVLGDTLRLTNATRENGHFIARAYRRL